MVTYPAVLDVPMSMLGRVADLVRARRRVVGSPWRRLSAGRQALLALVHLRKNTTYAELAAGFGVSIATAFRYVCEVVDLLAGRGTCPTAVLLRTDRTRWEKNYSGKHKAYGINVQAVLAAAAPRCGPHLACPGPPTT